MAVLPVVALTKASVRHPSGTGVGVDGQGRHGRSFVCCLANIVRGAAVGANGLAPQHFCSLPRLCRRIETERGGGGKGMGVSMADRSRIHAILRPGSNTSVRGPVGVHVCS